MFVTFGKLSVLDVGGEQIFLKSRHKTVFVLTYNRSGVVTNDARFQIILPTEKRKVEEHTDNRQKILIADDSEMNRSILTDMLGEEFDIIEAADGVEAIEQLEKYDVEISLVLLDIVMPRLDGFGVLAKMNEKI